MNEEEKEEQMEGGVGIAERAVIEGSRRETEKAACRVEVYDRQPAEPFLYEHQQVAEGFWLPPSSYLCSVRQSLLRLTARNTDGRTHGVYGKRPKAKAKLE